MTVSLEPWTETYTGKRMYFLEPEESMIDIRDIAHSLSMMCRFGGHVLKFYSVAEHCVNVAIQAFRRSEEFRLPYIEAEKHALQGLLHDASEAYLMDIPSPIKKYLSKYREIEDNLLKCILKKFNLNEELSLFVEEADTVMLKGEAEQLLPSKGNSWKHLYQTTYDNHKVLKCYSPKEAEDSYLSFFRTLRNGGNYV